MSASPWTTFYRNAIRRLGTTGAIAPSSKFLAESITRVVERRSAEPLTILEAGPGTGPFTKLLASKLRPGDALDLCELNDEFVLYLQTLIERDPVLNGCKSQIKIYHQALQSLEGESRYDYIISGLPLNNFSIELVTEILDTFRRLLKPGGKMAFFEYFMVRKMKSPFVYGKERERLKQLETILSDHLRTYESSKDLVLLNVPPSVVHVCEYN